MKKLAVFILILIPMFSLMFLNQREDALFGIKNISKVCVATTKDVSGDNVLNTLGYNYAFFDKDEIYKASRICYDGITIYVQNSSVEKVSKSLNMLYLKEEIVAGTRIVYGFTPKFSKAIFIDNKKVNVQIAVDNENLTIGFPTILEGF